MPVSLPYLLSYFLQTLYGMADIYSSSDGMQWEQRNIVGSQVARMTVMIVNERRYRAIYDKGCARR